MSREWRLEVHRSTDRSFSCNSVFLPRGFLRNPTVNKPEATQAASGGFWWADSWVSLNDGGGSVTGCGSGEPSLNVTRGQGGPEAGREELWVGAMVVGAAAAELAEEQQGPAICPCPDSPSWTPVSRDRPARHSGFQRQASRAPELEQGLWPGGPRRPRISPCPHSSLPSF